MAEELSRAIVAASRQMERNDVEKISFACIVTNPQYTITHCGGYRHCHKSHNRFNGIRFRTLVGSYDMKYADERSEEESAELDFAETHETIGRALSKLTSKGFLEREERLEDLLRHMYGNNISLVMIKKETIAATEEEKQSATDDFPSNIVRAGEMVGLTSTANATEEKDYLAIVITADLYFTAYRPDSPQCWSGGDFPYMLMKADAEGFRCRETQLEKFLQYMDIELLEGGKVLHVFSKIKQCNAKD